MQICFKTVGSVPESVKVSVSMVSEILSSREPEIFEIFLFQTEFLMEDSDSASKFASEPWNQIRNP